MNEAPREVVKVARLTAVETAADRAGDSGEIECLAPAAAAALRLLADAIQRGNADPDAIVQALKKAGVHRAFADVLDAASTVVTNGLEDPFEFDGRLRAENLSGAAGQVRDAFCWL